MLVITRGYPSVSWLFAKPQEKRVAPTTCPRRRLTKTPWEPWPNTWRFLGPCLVVETTGNSGRNSMENHGKPIQKFSDQSLASASEGSWTKKIQSLICSTYENYLVSDVIGKSGSTRSSEAHDFRHCLMVPNDLPIILGPKIQLLPWTRDKTSSGMELLLRYTGPPRAKS